MNLSLKAVLGAVALMCATEHAAFAQSPIRRNVQDVRQVFRAAERPRTGSVYRPAPTTSRPLPTYRTQPTYRAPTYRTPTYRTPTYRPLPTSRPGSTRMSSGVRYSSSQSSVRLYSSTRAAR